MSITILRIVQDPLSESGRGYVFLAYRHQQHLTTVHTVSHVCASERHCKVAHPSVYTSIIFTFVLSTDN
jgi:hypothetical protein